MAAPGWESDEVTRPDTVYWMGLRGKQVDEWDIPPPVPEKDDIYLPTASRKNTISSTRRPDTKGSLQRPMTMSTSITTRNGIKYGSGKHVDVELIPQPSDDPNDPLNWPQWRKELNLVSLLMMVGLIGAMKTVFISTNGVMTTQFNVSYSSIAALTAVPLMLSTLTGLLSAVAGKMIGKRPIYLVSFILIFVGSIWNMTTEDSYRCIMAARVFQGLGWGAFDTLVLGSIQDTYFEHERNFRISIYNVFTIATTWGSILVGGVVSHNAATFAVQFRIINGLFVIAIPLLILGAPETVFDRPQKTISFQRPSTATSTMTTTQRLPPITARSYLRDMRPWSYKGTVTPTLLLQAPRALVAPTTILVFLLCFIPYCFLWGFANTAALLLTPMPLRLTPEAIGFLMTGPWALATLMVAVFCFWRRFQENFTPLINGITTAVGTVLFAAGTLTFGVIVYNVMTRGTDGTTAVVNMNAGNELSLPLLSFLLGMLAAGVYVLDATTRPLIGRSASFTSSSMTVCQRCIADMHASVVVLRNFFAGVFILAIPSAVSTFGGLKATVIGLTVTQIGLAGGIAALWWFFDENIWRADGKIMRLVDWSILKQSTNNFAMV